MPTLERKSKVKICGITRLEDIEYVNEYKPDYVGFVFAESRRKVVPEQALRMRQKLSPDISAVGVFVNGELSDIANIVNCGAIEVIQLHGTESDSYIAELKTNLNRTVPIITAYKKSVLADYLIFDGSIPGSGNMFDWETVPQTDKPFFLAGGLNPDNVAAAVAKLNPFAVDVSSGVETDGVKDKDKIRDFIKNARF